MSYVIHECTTIEIDFKNYCYVAVDTAVGVTLSDRQITHKKTRFDSSDDGK